MGKIIKISKNMNITAQIQLNAGEQILYQSSDDIEVFLNDEPLEVESGGRYCMFHLFP